jgi:hypothetical protein
MRMRNITYCMIKNQARLNCKQTKFLLSHVLIHQWLLISAQPRRSLRGQENGRTYEDVFAIPVVVDLRPPTTKKPCGTWMWRRIQMRQARREAAVPEFVPWDPTEVLYSRRRWTHRNSAGGHLQRLMPANGCTSDSSNTLIRSQMKKKRMSTHWS